MSNQNDFSAIKQLTQRTKALEQELAQARSFNSNRRGGRHSQKNWLNESESPREEEEGWYTTYLDMMTLLLVLMIVMLAFAGQVDGPLDDGKAGGTGGGKTVGVQEGEDGLLHGQLGLLEKEAPSEADAASLAELGLDGLGDDIDVLLTDQSISFRINSEILFPSGNADLSRQGLAVLAKLSNILNKNNFPVAVEGHTDSIPIRSARYPSNWELSGARAGSVVRYFEANGVAKDRLRAVGYADTQPLADNATAEGRASNRRVELTMDIPMGTKLSQ